MTLPRPPRWLKIIVATYLAYLALVLLIATPLLNIFAPKIYRAQTGAELNLAKTLWLNPFTLSITARQASSPNADGSPLWSFDELKADVALASLWRGHLVLDALTLHGLDVQITQTAPTRFNFSDILDYRAKQFPPAKDETNNAQADATQATTPSPPFAIEITAFDFTAKQLGYRAAHAAEPINATLADLHIALSDFSTATNGSTTTNVATATTETMATAIPALRSNNIALSVKTIAVDFLRAQQPFAIGLHDLNIDMPTLATTADSDYAMRLFDSSGGSVQIKGSLALAQHQARGSVQLHTLNLVPAWQYLSNKLSFTAERARLDGDINFHLGWGEQFVYQVQDSKLALRDVQLQSRADADTGAAFSALRVEGIALDSAQPQMHIARVALEQPVLRGWNRDTKVSLLDMIYFPASDEQDEASPWQVLVDNIDVANGNVHWRASQLDNRQLTIAPLALHATNLHWPDAAPLQFQISTNIHSDTDASNKIQLALAGEIVPGDVTGKINGSIGNVPLTWGNTFVAQQLHARIASGALTTQFAVTLDKAQPVLVQSEGAIERFELQREADKRKLAAWQKLAWRQLALDPRAQRIDIKQIVLTQPWAQFRINADGTNNFQQLMVDTAAPTPSKAATTHKAASPETDNPAPTKTDKAASTQKSVATKSSDKPWQFAIDTIHVDRATIDFRDASLASAFRTNITELSGDISGLNSRGDKPAKVALKWHRGWLCARRAHRQRESVCRATGAQHCARHHQHRSRHADALLGHLRGLSDR